jgi:thymidylate synthase (FAD)
MLQFERLIFAPGVAQVANTVFINSGLEEAIDLSGIEDISETPDTPLYNLVGDVYADDNERGGNGEMIAEFAGRQCYRSWAKGRPTAEYILNVIAMGHGSVFEHASQVFQLTGVSRSLTHELARHRVGTAISQESQRYVDAKDIRFVVPPLLVNAIVGETGGIPQHPLESLKLSSLTAKAMEIFTRSCSRALEDYIEIQPLLKELCEQAHKAAIDGNVKLATSAQKRANEAARSVLPNATETRLLYTVNLRQMFHLLTLRGGEPADLEIRRLAVALLDHARGYAPNFFKTIKLFIGDDGLEALRSEVTKL